MVRSRSTRAMARLIILYLVTVVAMPIVAYGQEPSAREGIVSQTSAALPAATQPANIPNTIGLRSINTSLSLYADPVQGTSSSDLIRRALASNAELAAARIHIEWGRARLQQASLRSSPTVDFEHTTGRLTGSAGERETSFGFALPLELGGNRERRIDLAHAELNTAEAEIAGRERRLSAEVRLAYAEAMASLRELKITDNLSNLDTQMAHIIEAHVAEGASHPRGGNITGVPASQSWWAEWRNQSPDTEDTASATWERSATYDHAIKGWQEN